MAETAKRFKFQGFSTNAALMGVNPVYGLYTVLAATPIGATLADAAESVDHLVNPEHALRIAMTWQ